MDYITCRVFVLSLSSTWIISPVEFLFYLSHPLGLYHLCIFCFISSSTWIISPVEFLFYLSHPLGLYHLCIFCFISLINLDYITCRVFVLSLSSTWIISPVYFLSCRPFKVFPRPDCHSWILSFVFCLLSSVFFLLSSVFCPFIVSCSFQFLG